VNEFSQDWKKRRKIIISDKSAEKKRDRLEIGDWNMSGF